MALVLQVDIRIKAGNEEAFMHKLAVNAVPLLAARERHIWKRLD